MFTEPSTPCPKTTTTTTKKPDDVYAGNGKFSATYDGLIIDVIKLIYDSCIFVFIQCTFIFYIILSWWRSIVVRPPVLSLSFLRSTDSWPCKHYVGEASAISQPTRPTQPAIPPGSVK